MIKKLPPKNSFYPTISVVFVFVLLLAACSQKQPEATVPSQLPTPATAQVKPVQKQVSSSLRLSPPPPPTNQFDFSNKKDPFRPFVVVRIDQKNSRESMKKRQRDSLPIHSFDVSQFKLIGVITGGRENQAMVTDPAGKGYVLKVGMSIGKNDGRIISINSSGVEVLEQFKDDNGRVRKENIKLTLPRKQ